MATITGRPARCGDCGQNPCRCDRPRSSLASSREAIAPLRVHTEHWRRGARPPILLPCVCGGPEIRAMSSSQADVFEAVQRHQIEPVHIAYDEAHGIPLAVWQLQARAVDQVSEGR